MSFGLTFPIIARMTPQTPKAEVLIEAWSLRFARAYAEFVRALSEDTSDAPAPPTAPGKIGGFAIEDVSEADDPKGHHRMIEGHKAFLASVKSGKAEMDDFDPAVPAKAAFSRLKQICKQRGIKQSDIAHQLGVAPSVVSRIFKHPERSRLQTLRKIAEAAGIAMGELI